MIPHSTISKILASSCSQGLIEEEDTSTIFLDLDLLEARLQKLKSYFNDATLHAIPIKTNPLLFVLSRLVDLGFGLEAASFGEIELAKAAGIAPEKIVFDSPAKTFQEIASLCDQFSGCRVNADSLDELARYEPDTPLQLGLRINPLVQLRSPKSMDVSGRYSKFGEPIINQKEIIEGSIRCAPLNGLHVHAGSQNQEMESTVVAIRKVLDLAKEINAVAGFNKIRCIDIGGGMAYDYQLQNAEGMDRFIESLRTQCPELFNNDYQVVTEFGRYVYAPTAWVVSKVEYAKSTPTGVNAILHVGADMFVRECYNPETWYHHVSILNSEFQKPKREEVEAFLCGPLCFGGDVIGNKVTIETPEPGDFVVIKDIGANTFSLWSRHCSRPFPKVIAYSIRESTLRIAKARESYTSIVDFWS